MLLRVSFNKLKIQDTLMINRGRNADNLLVVGRRQDDNANYLISLDF